MFITLFVCLFVCLFVFLLYIFKKLTPFSVYDAESHIIKLSLGLVNARDLNFVLRLEIFVHYDGKLRASHLILGCTLSYFNYQDLGLAFLATHPLLTYIDVHLLGSLLNISVNEAWERGPCQTREGSLELIRDGLGDLVFHGRLQHIPISDVEDEEMGNRMVRWRNVEFGHYFSDAQALRDRAPPFCTHT